MSGRREGPGRVLGKGWATGCIGCWFAVTRKTANSWRGQGRQADADAARVMAMGWAWLAGGSRNKRWC